MIKVFLISSATEIDLRTIMLSYWGWFSSLYSNSQIVCFWWMIPGLIL